MTHSLHGYLDGYFNRGRVSVNDRRAGESRFGSSEDLVCVVTMQPAQVSLWLREPDREARR